MEKEILGLPEQVEKNKQDIEVLDEQNLNERVSINETNIETNTENISTNTEAIAGIGVDWFISSDGTEPTLPTSPTDLVDAKKGDAAYDITVGPVVSQGYRLIDDDPTILANWIPFDASGSVDLSNYYTISQVDNLLDDKLEKFVLTYDEPTNNTYHKQYFNTPTNKNIEFRVTTYLDRNETNINNYLDGDKRSFLSILGNTGHVTWIYEVWDNGGWITESKTFNNDTLTDLQKVEELILENMPPVNPVLGDILDVSDTEIQSVSGSGGTTAIFKDVNEDPLLRWNVNTNKYTIGALTNQIIRVHGSVEQNTGKDLAALQIRLEVNTGGVVEVINIPLNSGIINFDESIPPSVYGGKMYIYLYITGASATDGSEITIRDFNIEIVPI